MIDTNLFDSVLIDPFKDGVDNLFIVSGYATSAMAFSHMNQLLNLSDKVKINLIVGMCSSAGLSISNHEGFKKLVEFDFVNKFRCSYLINNPPVHSKLYVWCKGIEPIIGFTGSANYSQRAFSASHRQREVLTQCDPIKALQYFNAIAGDTLYCEHDDAENFVTIFNDKKSQAAKKQIKDAHDNQGLIPSKYVGLMSVKISFLDNKGILPQRSGLNWGQRPEEKREPNQAYIRLPAEIYKTDFFPEKAIHFTVLTDDNKVLICSRAQENGKAIHTPHNNSLIGEYFRNRLGLGSGTLIDNVHLEKYGRSDVDFYKIDDETYYLDFSVR